MCVIMIPQGPGILEIGIIIILILSNSHSVRSPSIKGGNCSGTMQMHGGSRVSRIDEAEYNLSSRCSFDSGPWIHPIVTNQTRGS